MFPRLLGGILLFSLTLYPGFLSKVRADVMHYQVQFRSKPQDSWLLHASHRKLEAAIEDAKSLRNLGYLAKVTSITGPSNQSQSGSQMGSTSNSFSAGNRNSAFWNYGWQRGRWHLFWASRYANRNQKGTANNRLTNNLRTVSNQKANNQRVARNEHRLDTRQAIASGHSKTPQRTTPTSASNGKQASTTTTSIARTGTQQSGQSSKSSSQQTGQSPKPGSQIGSNAPKPSSQNTGSRPKPNSRP